MKYKILTVLWLILITTWSELYLLQAKEQSVDKYFSDANNYYKNQNYNSALKIYQKLVDELKEKKSDASKISIYYYNLGNTYYKLHEIGYYTNQYLSKAVWSYEKSILYDMGNTDARYNLNVIGKKIDQDYENTLSFIEQIRWFFYSYQNIFSHFLGIIFAVVVGWIGCKFLKIKTKNYLKKLIFALGIIYVLVLGFSLIMLFYSPKNNWVIINKEINVKSEPNFSPDNKTVLWLSEGVKVSINRVSPDGKWIEIENKNQRGWIEESNYLSLDL